MTANLAHSHNCFIELNIKATVCHVFDLGEKNLCDKKVGGLQALEPLKKWEGLKPSGLLEVYAYVIW